MKKNILTKIIVILAIILVAIISFFGIYKRNLNNWTNILPKFNYGKELKGTRDFGFVIDDGTKEVEEDEASEEATSEENNDETANTETDPKEDSAEKDKETDKKEDSSKEDKKTDKKEDASKKDEKTDKKEDASKKDEKKDEKEDSSKEDKNVESEDNSESTEPETKEAPINPQEVLNVQNYKKSKEIIESRLKSYGIVDAIVSMNEENGAINIETSNTDITNFVPTLIEGKGDFEIIDSDTEECLIDRSMIKSATGYYVPSENSTAENPTYDLGISFQFNSNAQNKINEMTKKYIETTDENGETTQKTITIRINDTDIYKTYFSPEGTYTSINVPIYKDVQTSDIDTFNQKYRECLVYQSVLETDEMPIKYKVDSGVYLNSNLSENFLTYFSIATCAILVIIAVLMVKKYGKTGLKMALIEIGYVAILLLLIRVVGATLTLVGLMMIFFMSILNYLFMSNLTKTDKLEQLKKFLMSIIPFLIMILVFNFVKDINLLSVGIIGIWGIITFIYTFLVSLVLLEERNDI